MSGEKLNGIEIDALKEVSNIGSGNAATALSTLLNKKIDMNVPNVNLMKLQELYSEEGERLVYGIVVRVLGDIQGNVLMIFDEKDACNIVEALTGEKNTEISEMGYSVLCELGNIMAGSFLNAITQFTGICVIPSVPAVAFDMLSAILSTTFVESGQYDEHILKVETMFKNEQVNDLGVHFYYVPGPEAFEKILKSIGLK